MNLPVTRRSHAHPRGVLHDQASAILALEALDRRFGAGDTRIAVLSGTGEEPSGQQPEMILAGRFTDDVIAAVRRAVVELGGTVVVDVDEDRTR